MGSHCHMFKRNGVLILCVDRPLALLSTCLVDSGKWMFGASPCLEVSLNINLCLKTKKTCFLTGRISAPHRNVFLYPQAFRKRKKQQKRLEAFFKLGRVFFYNVEQGEGRSRTLLVFPKQVPRRVSIFILTSKFD